MLTSRAASRALPTASCVLDLDADGLPVLGSRALARVPTTLHDTLFASARELFGLADELVAPDVLGHRALPHVHGDVDALLLTLSLRMRGFRLCVPPQPAALGRGFQTRPSTTTSATSNGILRSATPTRVVGSR